MNYEQYALWTVAIALYLLFGGISIGLCAKMHDDNTILSENYGNERGFMLIGWPIYWTVFGICVVLYYPITGLGWVVMRIAKWARGKAL